MLGTGRDRIYNTVSIVFVSFAIGLFLFVLFKLAAG